MLAVPLYVWGITRGCCGGTLDVFGGQSAILGNPASDRHERYSSGSDSWAVKTDLPEVRGAHACWGLSDKGYLAYGEQQFDQAPSLLTTQEYTKSTDSWSAKSDGPAPARVVPAFGVITGKGYCAGGLNDKLQTHAAGGGSPLPPRGVNDTNEYDPAGDSWSSKSDFLPRDPTDAGSAWGIAGAVVDDKLYVTGANHLVQHDHFEFDPAGDAWTQKAALDWPSNGRDDHSAAGIDGKEYVWDSTTEEYTPGTDSWSTKTAPPTGFEGSSASVIDSLGYANPGFANYAYDPVSDSWSDKTATGSAFAGWHRSASLD